jgi:hypothetical protein
MSVGAQQIVCPCCESAVDVTVGDRHVVDAGVGHVEDDDGVVNQLCTACVEKIHVRVE